MCPDDILHLPHLFWQGTMNLFLVHDGISQPDTVHTQKLDIGTGNEIDGRFSNGQHPHHCRNGRVSHGHKAQGSQLLLHRAAIFRQHFRCHGRGQIGPTKQVQIQIMHRRLIEWFQIVGEIFCATFFIQSAFLFRCGRRTTGTHANPYSTIVAHWRRVGWFDQNDRHGAPFQNAFFHTHHGKRKDVSVRAYIGQITQQLVRNVEIGTASCIFFANENNARLLVVSHVVGKGAHSLTDGTLVCGKGLFALYPVRFHLVQQSFQLLIRHTISPMQPTTTRHTRMTGWYTMDGTESLPRQCAHAKWPVRATLRSILSLSFPEKGSTLAVAPLSRPNNTLEESWNQP
ncbi:hypothetical protein ASN18_2576 [Candidatus Magnetominusculus xianensis]|uniref:Uncharacterized protein n=1 Tax=Candidatus Magnetominusculus xianensis TaxID=1748249 RepID=A0ABR5SDU8_9BACT|nr:hypothetical protein ASN18_2576 [Candidatus Magnetominusculus xianensis]